MRVESHKAFSLIELIFVIMITGILAAVALPKLATLGVEAKKAKVLAFVGTLNRTVGVSMYVSAINTATPGKLQMQLTAVYCLPLEIPIWILFRR